MTVAIAAVGEAAPTTLQPGPAHPTAGKIALGIGAGFCLATVALTVIARQNETGREDDLAYVVPLFSLATASLVSLLSGLVLLTSSRTTTRSPQSNQFALTEGPRGSTVGTGLRIFF